MPLQQVQKVGWWHERLAEWMLANPDKSLKDAAPVFNCTPQMIYIIHNSDAFREHWAKVSGAVTKGVADPIVEKCRATAEAALDALLDRLALPGNSDMFVLDTADKMMKNLGFGVRAQGAAVMPTVQVNVTQVDASALAQARAKVEQLTSRPMVNVNVQAEDLQPLPAPRLAEASDASAS